MIVSQLQNNKIQMKISLFRVILLVKQAEFGDYNNNGVLIR